VNELAWAWWGDDLPYRATWARQRAAREAVLEGRGPEVFALLTHEPVVTLGKRRGELLVAESVLAAMGVDLVQTDRGGLATWHGPGQLVGYLIVDLGQRRLPVRALVAAMEDALIGWLSVRGVPARRRRDAVGVWLQDRKIAAVGLHVKGGVTLHGFALNLTCALDGFGLIVPCGIAEHGVTSLLAESGSSPSPRQAAPEVASAVLAALTPPGGTLNGGG